jgi:hypothetical protein
MKSFFYLFFLLIAITSCTKNEEPSINITNSAWYLERMNYGGGSVHLKINGSTNADSVKVKTYGDGVISWQKIDLNSGDYFDKDIIIAFSVTSVNTEEFVMTTEVNAYKGSKIMKAFLVSDKLKYTSDKDYPFEAEVIGPNLDCGIFSIRFTTNLDRVNEIADQPNHSATFIAKHLPADLQIAGLSIILDFRKIQDTELGPCTAMGPAYPWIYVLKAKLKN